MACLGQNAIHSLQPLHWDAKITSTIHLSAALPGPRLRRGCVPKTPDGHLSRQMRHSIGSPHASESTRIFIVFRPLPWQIGRIGPPLKCNRVRGARNSANSATITLSCVDDGLTRRIGDSDRAEVTLHPTRTATCA